MPRSLSLTDAQQFFLQIMLNNGVIDQLNFKTLFCNVLTKFEIRYNESEIKSLYVNFLREINEVIKNFNMEIKTGMCEITGLSYFCIIRLCDTSSIGNLSMLYTSTDLKTFRKILELIIESDQGCVDYNLIVNEIYTLYDELSNEAVATQSNVTKVPSNRDIRLVVEKFMQDKWLIEVINQPNMITLHGRALIELSQYIKQIFDNDLIGYCFLCKSIVLSYFSCEHCSIKMHKYCAKRVFKNTKDCPSCKATFSNDRVSTLLDSISSAKNSYASSQVQSP